MSVRHGLLAVLAQGPCYGHQLRQEFDRRTGGTWQVNAGQVYQTLDRLERDKLIVRDGEDSEGRELFAITASGRTEVDAWLRASIVRGTRDELAVKVAIAATLPGIDAASIIAAQRRATAEALAALVEDSDDLGESIVLAAARETGEADLRWLDTVEQLLATAEPYGLSAEQPRRGRPARSHTPS